MIASKLSKTLIIAGLLLLGGVCLSQLSFSTDPILIESFESKTHKGHAVFNQIKFTASGDKDVWTMYQSHKGVNAPFKEWDHISITVDKTQKPYVVRYQQFKEGEEIELKASCYTCHANGPRAIRPHFESAVVSYDLKKKLMIKAFNLRMKSYGRVTIAQDNYQLKGKFRVVPLKYFGKNDVTVLKLKTCQHCHNTDSFFGRGELQRQHADTIRHLVNNKQMPPWPFSLTQEEKKELDRFVRGF